MFWSSDKLTGSQTFDDFKIGFTKFWSSDKLTGSQTIPDKFYRAWQFWSSDKLMDIVFVGNVVIVHVYLVLFCSV